MPDDAWLPPSTVWPSHGDGDMQEALDLARIRGWWYRRVSSHTGAALLYCRRDPDDACVFPVFGTGRSPGGPARSFKRKINTCRHLVVYAVSQTMRAEVLLSSAERIVTAAESLVEQVRLRGQSDALLAEAEELDERMNAAELLEIADEQIDQVEKLLECAAELDSRALSAGTQASELLAMEGDDIQDLDVSALIVRGEQVIKAAEQSLANLPRRSGTAAALRNKIETVRGRISLIRAEVGIWAAG